MDTNLLISVPNFGDSLIYRRLGYLGYSRKSFTARMNRLLGVNQWRIGHIINGKVISEDEALQLYEESYYQYLKSRPELVQYIVTEGSDVYDTDPSNVASGMNYSAQEGPASHIQDIAVRRCIHRLGLKFTGSKLLRIRGPESELHELHPGKIPFLYPDKIINPRWFKEQWIELGTVEDFWQNNKFLFILPTVESIGSIKRNLDQMLIKSPGRREHHKLIEETLVAASILGQLNSEVMLRAESYYRRIQSEQTIRDIFSQTIIALDYHSSLRQPQLHTASILKVFDYFDNIFRNISSIDSMNLVINFRSDPRIRAMTILYLIRHYSNKSEISWIIRELANDTAAQNIINTDPVIKNYAKQIMNDPSTYSNIIDLINNLQGAADTLGSFIVKL